ncbi:MAG: hypothetical protein ACLR2G_06680 [Phascolarctobacterium faecium]
MTIYRAQKVVTMNPQMPWAECVAVAGGTIIAVGDFIDMEAYLKRMLLLIISMIRLSTMLFIPVLSKPICTLSKAACII